MTSRLFVLTALLILPTALSAQPPTAPRLVLQITVDGFRADLLNRYADRFGDGGFNWLLANGVVFTNAHHDHANTETIVGHTTLATGAYPGDHGMIGNAWLDRSTGDLGYNIEDASHPLLPTRDRMATGDQVDPAQAAARSDGRSPRAIHGSTFSDELAVATAGRAKIFAVSGKDRGAIPLAGRSGKAFWMSTDTGDFVTSSFYYDDYPVWVKSWNAQRQAESFGGKEWELSAEPSTYLFADRDDRPYEIDLRGYGRTFPHPFGSPDDGLFFTRILVSPVGDELTLDFAKQVVANESVGEDDITDFLSVSFSGVDAINHFFGPSSLENEEVVLRLDRTLENLLTFIDEEIGFENTVIVLAADHGMAEMPEYMQALGHETSRIYSQDVVAAVDEISQENWGIDGLARLFYRPYLYLDHVQIERSGLVLDDVVDTIAQGLANKDGINLAVPRTLQSATTGSGAVGRIQHNYHPRRSGDVYVAQEPYWFLFERGAIGVMHGSPWRYDTHVPIIFAGFGTEQAMAANPVRTVDVAPTLSGLLGIKQPSNARGRVLPEVVR